jgi:hypothetical protein
MHRRMVILMVELTGYASIRYVAVSLPLVEAILDHKKYRLPSDNVPPSQSNDLRRLRQGKVKPRPPSFRSLGVGFFL